MLTIHRCYDCRIWLPKKHVLIFSKKARSRFRSRFVPRTRYCTECWDDYLEAERLWEQATH